MGTIYLARHDYNRAVEEFNHSTQLKPNADTFATRGIAHAKLGQATLAIEDYDRALTLDPNDVDSLVLRAQTYLETDNDDQASADFDRAIKMKPTASALIGRGILRARRGLLNDAVGDFTEAARLRPSDPDSRRFRGIIYLKRGDLERALQDLSEAIRLNPSDPASYANRADIYVQKGDYDAASKDADMAVQLSPNSSSFHAVTRRGGTKARVREPDREMAS